MDLDQYDEFGTYIGPELESSDDSVSDQEQPGVEGAGDEGSQGSGAGQELQLAEDTGMEVVLHEDKKYYPTAQEVCYYDAKLFGVLLKSCLKHLNTCKHF